MVIEFLNNNVNLKRPKGNKETNIIDIQKGNCYSFEKNTDKIDDFRAKRITSYLNLIHEQAEKKFEALKNVTAEKSDALKEYIHMKKSQPH